MMVVMVVMVVWRAPSEGLERNQLKRNEIFLKLSILIRQNRLNALNFMIR